jgi:hypothetical protein
MWFNVANLYYWLKVTKHLHSYCYKLYDSVQILEAIVSFKVLMLVLHIFVSIIVESTIKYYNFCVLLYNTYNTLLFY